jgi:hypothetical protein
MLQFLLLGLVQNWGYQRASASFGLFSDLGGEAWGGL